MIPYAFPNAKVCYIFGWLVGTSGTGFDWLEFWKDVA